MDFLRTDEPTGILVSPHYSVHEPDTQHLIRRGPDRLEDGPLYVCGSAADEESLSDRGLDSTGIEVVQPDTWAFVSALLDSKRAILRGHTHLHAYRFFGRSGTRDYVLLYHGIITKAYGAHAEDSDGGSALGRLKQRILDWYLHADLDVQAVASDVERFYRSSAEGRHPGHFRTFGYPRYDRARELLDGIVEPALDASTRETLRTDETTILYAPTHKDGEYETSLFPFADGDLEQFRSYLEDNGMQLLLRLHPAEEERGVADDLVDGSRIRYVGQDVAPSPMELLPYVDVLVTDYSSIYVDFLPFDRPVVFVRDRPEKFDDIRGIAFDYDRYFPGESVSTMEEFVDHLSRIRADGTDGRERDREFVRSVLLPDWRDDALGAFVNPDAE